MDLPIDASMMGTILLVALGAFLLFSLLLGFIRGFKKAIVRLMWLIITAIAVFFATPPLATFLNSYDVSSFNLNIMGPVTHLSDIGVNLIKAMNLEEALNSSPALQSFAQNLPTMILNVILFVVLFWVLKILLYPLFLIIYSRVFDKKKRQERLYKKRIAEVKKKGMPIEDEPAMPNVKTSKLRLLGGLIGVVCGLIVLAVTLSPLVGATYIYDTVNANVTVEKDGETVPYLSTMIDDDVQVYIDSYEDSVARKIITYSGVSLMGNAMFSNLAVVKVGDKTIKLVDEVSSASNIYNKGLRIYSLMKDRENITYTDINEALSLAESILESLDKSEALYTLGGELSEYAVDNYLVTEVNKPGAMYVVSGEDLTDIVKSVVNGISGKGYSIKDYQEQLVAVLDIASLLNDVKIINDGVTTSLLAEVVSGRMSDVKDILSFLADGITNFQQFAHEFASDVLAVDILNDVLPDVVNKGVEKAFDVAGITGFVKKEDMTLTNIQNGLEGVIENGLKFYQIYKDGEDLDFGTKEQTAIALGSVGKTIDVLKANLLSSESYLPSDETNTTDGLLNFLISKANTYAEEGFADVSSVTTCLKEITSYQTELESLSNLYRAVVLIATDEENPLTEDSILDKDYTAIFTIGEPLANVIDSAGSKIITNKNLREIASIVFDKLASQYEDANDYLTLSVSGKTLKELILDNIYNLETNDTAIKNDEGKSNWGSEIQYTLSLVREIASVEDLQETSAEQMSAIGASLDNALNYTKLAISNEVIRAIIDKVLDDYTSDIEKLNEIMNISINGSDPTITTKSSLLNNVYNTTTYTSSITSYSQEFEIIQALFSADFDDLTLTKMGKVLDDIADSKLLSRDIVKGIITYYVRDLLNSLDDASVKAKITDGVNVVITNIKNETMVNGSYPINYETEFATLESLMDTMSATYSTDEERFTAIGGKFNAVLGIAGSTTQPSKIITKSALNSIISNYIDSFVDVDNASLDADLKTIIKNMKGENGANLNNIQDYALEMGYLVDLIKVKDKTNLEQIGALLDSMSSSAILSNTIQEVVAYYFNKEVNKLSDTSLATAIRPIENNVSSITSYETELKYVDDMMSIINVSGGASINFVALGEEIDTILAPTASLLIRQADINRLVTYFFTSNSNIVNNKSDFTDAFDLVEAKVVAETEYSSTKYKDMFDEFNTMTSSLASLKGAVSYTYDDFKNDTIIGSTLDTYATMTYASDKFVAKQIAKVIVNTLIDLATAKEAELERNDLTSAINSVLIRDEFDFANYAESDTWNEAVDDANYFSRLITAIQNELPALS